MRVNSLKRSGERIVLPLRAIDCSICVPGLMARVAGETHSKINKLIAKSTSIKSLTVSSANDIVAVS